MKALAKSMLHERLSAFPGLVQKESTDVSTLEGFVSTLKVTLKYCDCLPRQFSFTGVASAQKSASQQSAAEYMLNLPEFNFWIDHKNWKAKMDSCNNPVGEVYETIAKRHQWHVNFSTDGSQQAGFTSTVSLWHKHNNQPQVTITGHTFSNKKFAERCVAFMLLRNETFVRLLQSQNAPATALKAAKPVCSLTPFPTAQCIQTSPQATDDEVRCAQCGHSVGMFIDYCFFTALNDIVHFSLKPEIFAQLMTRPNNIVAEAMMPNLTLPAFNADGMAVEVRCGNGHCAAEVGVQQNGVVSLKVGAVVVVGVRHNPQRERWADIARQMDFTEVERHNDASYHAALVRAAAVPPEAAKDCGGVHDHAVGGHTRAACRTESTDGGGCGQDRGFYDTAAAATSLAVSGPAPAHNSSGVILDLPTHALLHSTTNHTVGSNAAASTESLDSVLDSYAQMTGADPPRNVRANKRKISKDSNPSNGKKRSAPGGGEGGTANNKRRRN